MREQPTVDAEAKPEDRMIVEHDLAEELAQEIDISLCEACGLLRMKGPDSQMRDNDDDLPRDVVAALISQVRQDIGRLQHEHRESFQTIERAHREASLEIQRRLDTEAGEIQRRLDTVCVDVTALKLARAQADGKSDGVKMVLGIIITLSTMLGGAIAWAVSHIPGLGGRQ